MAVGSQMSVYSRYASREHDKEYFKQLNDKKQHDEIQIIPIGQMNGTFDNHQFENPKQKKKKNVSIDEWLNIFKEATFYTGYDEKLFEQVITMVYRNSDTDKLCTASLTKFGLSVYENMVLDSNSRFWPSCENLSPKYKKSNTKRALAISNLKN